jgi:hypothetical protein
MRSRDERREANQRLFRRGNEHLRDVVGDRIPRLPFLCDCADEFCDGRVEVDRVDWEAVAAKPNHFLMVSGHPRSDGELVVGTLERYDVVRKPD